MKTWIIEPRDPLIVRDGRPFGPDPGARARTLPFPFPSTIAGGVRTRHGQHRNGGIFPAGDEEVINEVLALKVLGPLLAEIDDEGKITQLLLPAPADTVLLRINSDEKQVSRRRLLPLSVDNDATDLPSELSPVGMAAYDPAKPVKEAPAFWNWSTYESWLQAPADDSISRNSLGHSGPLREVRMHVFIDTEKQVAREGFLFLTSGLEFARPAPGNDSQFPPRHKLALTLRTDGVMAPGLAPLGGERRLMAWRQSNHEWPQIPHKMIEQIVSDRACRIILLTPAYFEEGWRPHWLLQERQGVQPTLKAAVVRQPQVVSGWDFAIGKAKPSRRLAPAGSVYFLSLDGEPEHIRRWVKEMWFETVSDDPEQNRLDGFGLAIIGTWSGQPEPLGGTQ
jgi:CRISPR-associated protein Cmr3